jgi:tetratricopeptide (TPR) repeat protein
MGKEPLAVYGGDGVPRGSRDATKQPLYIATLPRQGYQFINPVADRAEPAEPPHERRLSWPLIAGAACAVALIALVALPLRPGGRLASTSEAAQRAFDRGLFLVAQIRPESSVLAKEAFEEAVRLEPAFARAHAELALVHVSLFLTRRSSRVEALEHAQAAADRALALDRDSAEAHIAQGAIAMQLLGRAPLAERALRRAVALDGSNARGLDLLARALRQTGRFDESLTVARRALAIEPTSVRAHMNLAQSMLFAGTDLNEALELCRQALELDATSAPVLDQAAEIAEAAARLDDAVAYRARAERAWSRPGMAQLIEDTYRTRGFAAAMTQFLEARLADLNRDRMDDPSVGFERGRLLAKLGRLDEAFAAFDTAVAAGYSVGVAALRHHPAYRALRADPRFEPLFDRTVTR